MSEVIMPSSSMSPDDLATYVDRQWPGMIESILEAVWAGQLTRDTLPDNVIDITIDNVYGRIDQTYEISATFICRATDATVEIEIRDGIGSGTEITNLEICMNPDYIRHTVNNSEYIFGTGSRNVIRQEPENKPAKPERRKRRAVRWA